MRTRRTFYLVKRWAVLLATALVLLALQTAPGLFAVFGVKPLLLLPYAICFAVFFRDKDAAMLALFCGALWDAFSGQLFGFSCLILLACSVASSLLVMYLIRANLINALILTAGTLFVYDLLDFVFGYLIWGYENVWAIPLYHMLPTMLYTLIITPLFYFLCRFYQKVLVVPV